MASNSNLGCLICSEEPEEADDDHYLYRDGQVRKNVLHEIFRHFLIPSESVPELYRLCQDERFCPRCLQVVDDVSQMLRKISTLKLLVQNKAEFLGKLIASTPIHKVPQNGPARRTRKQRELWDKLRNPVFQSKWIW
jgi:hypothetical protein